MIGLLTAERGRERAQHAANREHELGQAVWGCVSHSDGRASAGTSREWAEALPDGGPHAHMCWEEA